MTRPTLAVNPELHETERAVRYEFDLGYSNGRRREILYYEVARQPETTPVGHYDGVLCAIIVHAMRERLDIRLRGPATETMLRNLKEFQLAWSCWLPQVYQPVEIEADTTLQASPRLPLRTVAALSGGVDSYFTLLRHQIEPSTPPHPIESTLMVHGFDVSLANSRYFDELVARTAEMREFLGLSLRTIRTNSKELRLQKWEDSCGAELAACLHLCSGEFSEGLIGSSEPYDAMILPWGSNPVTDHLLSGGHFKITHDGAAFSRTEKVAFIAGSPIALRTLKVCWEGEQQSRNCGVCEKCVRTQLNLLAVGVRNPPCFDAPLDLGLISSIPIRSELALSELRTICVYAERRGIEAEWLRLLQARIRKETATHATKKLAKEVLAKIGLVGPASRLRDLLLR
jgi:hypothetical protein